MYPKSFRLEFSFSFSFRVVKNLKLAKKNALFDFDPSNKSRPCQTKKLNLRIIQVYQTHKPIFLIG
jgi:hypothetical protein